MSSTSQNRQLKSNDLKPSDSNPLVTIAIPTFNRLNLLKEAILSASSQSYKNLEIIVSDNFSGDGTIDFLKQLKDSRIRVNINTKNIGMVGNWQQCLDMAQGEYFLMMSDDDKFLSNDAILKMIEGFKVGYEKVVSAVFAGVVIRKEHKNSETVSFNDFEYDEPWRLISDFYSNKIAIYPCATMLRTKNIRSLGGYIGFGATLAVDACIWISTILNYGKAVFINEALCMYRIHDSLSSSAVEVMDQDFLIMRNLIEGHESIRLNLLAKREIKKQMDCAWNRIPLGYCVRRYRYKKGAEKNSDIYKNIWRWKRRIFSFSNIRHLSNHFFKFLNG